MNKRKIGRIVLLIFSILSWAVFAWLLAIMSALISVGNEPHKSDDVNGLVGFFGVAAGVISTIPLALAIIFTICTILAFRKSKPVSQ